MITGIRPHDFMVSSCHLDPSALNIFSIEGEVNVVEPLGSETFIHLETTCGRLATARDNFMPDVGQRLICQATLERLYFFDATTVTSPSSCQFARECLKAASFRPALTLLILSVQQFARDNDAEI